MREKQASLKYPVNGEEISVPDSPHLNCPKCHQVVLRFDDARKLRHRALEMYRQKYGLLSADDIRSLGERLGLTQAELARLCASAPTRSRAGRPPATSRRPRWICSFE
jgi:uncharacterized small protein (DUF1192 family)